MARVAGVDLPSAKRLDIALRYVYGIGPFLANKIIHDTGIDPATRVKNLTEVEIKKINELITRDFKVEGDLRRIIQQNVRRLIDIGCYRGIRHRRNLPTRGQRTRTNARTRRGKRRTVGATRVTPDKTQQTDKKE
jgi:small subunit ribosomal protein S13